MANNGFKVILAAANRSWRGSLAPLLIGGALAICTIQIAFYSPYNQADYAAYRASKAKENIPEPTSEDRKRDADDAIALYTLWLMVFTGVLAVSTVGLWVVTWRGASSQGRDMKDTITHAETAAKAAQRSAEVATRTLIASNRAWLKVDIIEVSNVYINEDRVNASVSVNVENVGNSPALKCFIGVFIIVAKKRRWNVGSEIRNCIDVAKTWEFTEFMLFPGDTRPAGSSFHQAEIKFTDDMVALDGLSYPLHILVCVTYTFVSDKEVLHHSSAMKVLGRRDGKALTVASGDIPHGMGVLNDYPLIFGEAAD